jgi:hypothetical protein
MQKKSKKVVIFRKDLLPLSETFILDQFLSYKPGNLVGPVIGFAMGSTFPEFPPSL